MKNFEKLGAFYLGKHHKLDEKKTTDELLLYDSKDLTTHAVCVGMTGSGKTGLCVSLLEEAALDGIPAIAIDPKGDLGNLLLTFPNLDQREFLPWVNADDARKNDLSVEAYAAQQAELWRNGLAAWGQDGERIRRLRAAADFAIYTPGSEAGLPISILASFGAPSEAIRTDADLLRERVASTTTGLLGVMGIKADPIQSREHVLLSNLLEHAWREGRDLDLAGLIQAIQEPPMQRVGVLEMDSFYPEKQRFELAMRLNNLLAAPTFQGWLKGQTLNVQELLYTAEGRPRMAIISIAHLSEAERMFFVSLLLNQVLSWMRSRPGTTSLRALLYMDEIFGFVPPGSEPPSKKPFLTLLKQARAYGLGVVLATQNPVDLDYKGLSNAGTWFLGRLQTERDKMRVLEGLEGVAAGGGGFDKQQMERTLAGLGKRVFLMHNVHDDGPSVFHTRWAMSYLRGPLTRDQIKRLKPEQSAPTRTPGAAATPAALAPPAAATAQAVADRPLLPPGVPEVFLPIQQLPGNSALHYEPRLLGLGRVQFVDRKTKKTKHTEEIALLLPLATTLDVDWEQAAPTDLCREDLETQPAPAAGYGAVADSAERKTSYTKWRRELSNMLYRTCSLDLQQSPSLGLISEPGESEGDFRVRLSDLAREKRDRLTDGLRKKYTRRMQRLEDRIRRAEQKVETEKTQAGGQKMQTAISLGATVLAAFLGRKKLGMGTLGRATTTMRGASRAAKEAQDIQRATENLAALREELTELTSEMEREVEDLEDRMDPMTEELTTTSLRPRKSDIDVRLVALAWAPHAKAADGSFSPLTD